MLFHLDLIVSFQTFLIGWQECSVRVVNKVDLKLWIATVADGIELLKSADRGVKDSFTALLVDVVWRITRHRSNYYYLVLGVELGDPFVAGFLDDSRIQAGHHGAWIFKVSDTLYKVPEVWDHLWRTTCEIESGDVSIFKPRKDSIDCLAGHDFFPLGASIDVAMEASEVTEFTDVELEYLRRVAAEWGVGIGKCLVECVHEFR